ncbi:hypothetical protein QU408_06020 [Lactobacillus crispatus]
MADKAAIQVEVQQAIAQVLMRIYDPHFSEHSYGFRPNHSAMMPLNKYWNILMMDING